MTMLDVKAIDLHYGAAQALRGVSLQAELGEVTCVLGRNGVGKTSLLDALAGQQPISGGSIQWEGADITRLKPYERARRGIAYVPQGREIFPLLTVEENLKTGFAPLKRDRARHSRRRVQPVSGAATTCCTGAAATCPAASSSNWPSAARW